MDTPIERRVGSGRWKRVPGWWVAFGLLLLVALAWSLLLGNHPKASATPAAADLLTVVSDTSGALSARATLVPRTTTVVPAGDAGTVMSQQVTAGDTVTAGQSLVVLANPQLQSDLDRAIQEQEIALADLQSTTAEVAADDLAKRGEVVRAQGQSGISRRVAEADAPLAKKGIISRLQFQRDTGEAEQFSKLAVFAKEQQMQGRVVGKARIAAAQRKATIAGQTVASLRDHLAGLTIKAPVAGMVSKVSVNPGQRLSEGTEVAQIMSSTFNLQIQVAPSDANHLSMGDAVTATSSLGSLRGHITSILPRSNDGFILAIAILKDPPAWARADLVLEATVMPAHTQSRLLLPALEGVKPNSTAKVLRVSSDNDRVPVRVRFGPRIGNSLVVASGLSVGDRVIGVKSSD